MGKAKNRSTRQARSAAKIAAEKKPAPQASRRPAAAGSRLPGTPEKLALELPNQSPPVQREYLRALVGRQGKPPTSDEIGGSGKKRKKDQGADDYFVQLKTFHVLPNRRA
jgi:hypothetical protein